MDYRCSKCDQPTPREQLTVKRVMFTTMGSKAKRLRIRTEGWLCPTCRENDPMWQMEDARRGRAWYPDDSSANDQAVQQAGPVQ